MKKMIKTAIATAITALSFNAHAEGIAASPFTYLEYSMGNIEYDGAPSEYDGDYSALSGSIELPMLLIPILSAELIDFDDSNITKLGAGSYLQFGGATHLYGLIHYNDYEADVDNDFSLTVSLRHAVTESLYVSGSWIEYTDQDSLDGIKLSVGYYFHPNFSVSANYAALDSLDILSIGARVSF